MKTGAVVDSPKMVEMIGLNMEEILLYWIMLNGISACIMGVTIENIVKIQCIAVSQHKFVYTLEGTDLHIKRKCLSCMHTIMP